MEETGGLSIRFFIRCIGPWWSSNLEQTNFALPNRSPNDESNGETINLFHF